MSEHISIPTRTIGPVRIVFADDRTEDIMVPLSTYESPLWPSVARGARVSRLVDGIRVTVLDDRMTRSVILQATDAATALRVRDSLDSRLADMAGQVRTTSRFATLVDQHIQIVGNLLYIRFAMTTGDAAGHNMVTRAADALIRWVMDQYPSLEYVSISGNICTDKKVSAINGILGRGKNVVAEITIPGDVCRKWLKTDPRKIVDLNIRKNLVGSILSGGVRSANAHYANILLAFYLATGQDAANIVEGSQGITLAEMRGEDLYFSVTCPNIIVGTVGNGKNLDFARRHLEAMGCMEERLPGENSRRLASIAVAATLCSELSLMASQTIPGDLMQAHERLERQGVKN
ncbi:MAG: hydroxymethylglutaryl-CoA reductase [Pseudomonadota bacterium]|nr:hydroxymethylglutaryl-CoA reductase [Pseudomonadota bacterium]